MNEFANRSGERKRTTRALPSLNSLGWLGVVQSLDKEICLNLMKNCIARFEFSMGKHNCIGGSRVYDDTGSAAWGIFVYMMMRGRQQGVSEKRTFLMCLLGPAASGDARFFRIRVDDAFR